jgi:multiple sugar transport system ATP-binding protein
MNTIAGSVSGPYAGAPASVSTAVGTLAVGNPGTAVGGTQVMVGIRPEHLQVVDAAGNPDALRARVENIELLGHERHVVCAVGESLMTVRQPNDAVPVAVGQEISLHADPAGVHLFDVTSTERLN